MRVVIPVWVKDGSSSRFEASVPLQFVGRRNRTLGYSTRIDLVFLEGFRDLDGAYRAQLREIGYILHDAGDIYQRHAEKFRALDRFGSFEKYCFLRWLVLADYFKGEKMLHFDGDTVFNECPLSVAQLFAGRNLVLQGCPALAAINSDDWFKQYTEQLIAFSRDVDGYSTQAWVERTGWESSFVTKWAGSRDRRTITSDQDLLSHLIHTGRLVQDDPVAFMRSAPGHVFFENPLLIGDLVGERPLVYRRVANIDYLNNRRIAIWHMQSEWCRYLAKHMVRDRLGALAGSGRLSFAKKDWETLLNTGIRKLTRGRWLHRRAIYQRYFVEKDLSDVLTGAYWWQEGVF